MGYRRTTVQEKSTVNKSPGFKFCQFELDMIEGMAAKFNIPKNVVVRIAVQRMFEQLKEREE